MGVCIYIYTYIYTYTHIYTHVQIHTPIYISVKYIKKLHHIGQKNSDLPTGTPPQNKSS